MAKSGSILGLLDADGDEDEFVFVSQESSTETLRAPNEQQVIAIDAPLNVSAVRVLAGPGSGKTFVMTRRVAHLLESRVPPEDIIAVTLTKTMATEMWERLVRLIPAVVNTPLERTVCTIHALCFRIWREWSGESRRVPKPYEIEQTLEELADANGFNGDRGMKATPDVLEAWVNSSKGAGYETLSSKEFYRSRVPEPWIADALYKIRVGFDEWLAREGYITFADMMLNVEVLLRNDNAAKALGGRYVIVDEGQDATNQAMRILTKLSQGGQFFIVGDADQLLFRFAGATPEANLGSGWETLFPGGVTHKLEVNYRSTSAIIEGANRLIMENYDETNDHLRKTLRPRPDAGDGIDHEFRSFPRSTQEGMFVAEKVNELVRDEQNGYGDFFVGGRTRASLASTERALTLGQVPYVNLAGRSFWALKHVQAVWSYLAVAIDGNDRDAYKEIYNVASRLMRQPFDLRKDGKVVKAKGVYVNHRWLGRAFLGEYPSYSSLERVSPRDVTFRFRSGAEDLRWTIEDVRSELSKESVEGWVHVLAYIVDEIVRPWYREDHAAAEGQGSAFDEDIDVVLEIAREYEDPAEFIAFAKRMLEATHDETVMDECVVLGTIHKLKGRERPVVFWVGAAEGICPTPFALGQVMPRQNELPAPGGPSLMEDERCCAYVVLTRAKERVIITAPEFYRNKPVMTSRFVSEFLGGDLVPAQPGLMVTQVASQEVHNAENVQE